MCVQYASTYIIYPPYICSQFSLSIERGSMCAYLTKIDNSFCTTKTNDLHHLQCQSCQNETLATFHLHLQLLTMQSILACMCLQLSLLHIFEYLQAIILITMTINSF